MIIPDDVQSAIRKMVENGYFRDTDEALRVGVKLLKERNRRLQWLRNAIAETDAQIERGEGIVLTPELMDEIDREVDEMVLRGEMPSPDVCP